MQAAIAAKDAEIERLTTENAALKQQLLSNGLVPGAAPSHKELPAALQNFVPLANAPAVQAVLPALDAATEAVGRAADAAALDAAIEALRAVGETAVEAYAAAIAERVAQPDCISGKRARRSRLQRLRSRPFPTRVGWFFGRAIISRIGLEA